MTRLRDVFWRWIGRFDPDLAAGWSRARGWLVLAILCMALTLWSRPEQFWVTMSLEAKFAVAVISAWLVHRTFFYALYRGSTTNELDPSLPGAQIANFWANVVQQTIYYATLALVMMGSLSFWGIGLG